MAAFAPPAVQYKKAESDINRLYDKSNDWRKVAMNWYASKYNQLTEPPCDTNSTMISRYGNEVMQQMNSYLENPMSIEPVPGIPTKESNPAIAHP